MATRNETARGRSVINDVGGRVGHTLEATVTDPPGWRELTWDAVLIGAALVEAVSPPRDSRRRAEPADSRRPLTPEPVDRRIKESGCETGTTNGRPAARTRGHVTCGWEETPNIS
jgi:hypothetical protein